MVHNKERALSNTRLSNVDLYMHVLQQAQHETSETKRSAPDKETPATAVCGAVCCCHVVPKAALTGRQTK